MIIKKLISFDVPVNCFAAAKPECLISFIFAEKETATCRLF